MFNNLINIITAPKDAFVSVREKPSVLFPMFLIAILSASLQYGYYQFVDRDFLVDQLVEQAASIVSVPESQLREGIEKTSTASLALRSSIPILIIVPIIFCLYAGYLSLISKFTYDEIKFKQWLGLSCWTSIPAIFGILAGWVVLLTNSDGMIALTDIKPLTLNGLIFRMEGGMGSLLSNIDLTQIWSLVLMVLGYMHWTKKGGVKSTLIVTGPYLVILGIALAVILT